MMKMIVAGTLCAALLVGCAPPAKDLTITGELYYTETIKLPPTAKAHIEITLPATDEGPKKTLASADVPAPGTPIPFTLTVRAKDVPKDAQMMLSAQVRDGERYFFVADADTPITAATASKTLRVRMAFSPPVAVAYKCGADWYSIAFDDAVAKVAPLNLAPVTLSLMSGGPGSAQTYSNGKITVVHDGATVSFAMGKAAPQPCVIGKS
jgi:uncharacterized lipoprotein YbaY